MTVTEILVWFSVVGSGAERDCSTGVTWSLMPLPKMINRLAGAMP